MHELVWIKLREYVAHIRVLRLTGDCELALSAYLMYVANVVRLALLGFSCLVVVRDLRYTNLDYRQINVWRLISGFRRDVNEICDLLGFLRYRVVIPYRLFGTTYRDPWCWQQYVPKRRCGITTLLCVKSQMRTDLIKCLTCEVERATILWSKNIPHYTINN